MSAKAEDPLQNFWSDRPLLHITVGPLGLTVLDENTEVFIQNMD